MTRFRVTATELNVRPAPGTDNTPLGRLKEGATVEKLGEGGDWYFVSLEVEDDSFLGEIAGWVHSKYLAEGSEPEPATPIQPVASGGTVSPAPGPAITSEPFSIDSDLKQRLSPLTAGLIDGYLEKKDSPLAGLGPAVLASAQKYGINATYIISHAIHETGWGNSKICREKNNLFGWGAIDNDPYGGAGSFASREVCIDYVMEKVNELYLNPDGRYFESKPCLGNTSYGMNAHYATDPEWGLKIARIAGTLEAWVLDRIPPGAKPIPTPGELSSAAQSILVAVARVNPEQPYYLKHDITGDGVPETFCNWFVADVLDSVGIQLPRYDASAGYYPIPHPVYGSANNTKPLNADSLYDYFTKGGEGKWREVSRVEAVALANQGKVVVVSIPGHIALVIPGGHEAEVRIAQAGRLCGKNMKLEAGFGQAQVKFFCHND